MADVSWLVFFQDMRESPFVWYVPPHRWNYVRINGGAKVFIQLSNGSMYVMPVQPSEVRYITRARCLRAGWHIRLGVHNEVRFLAEVRRK